MVMIVEPDLKITPVDEAPTEIAQPPAVRIVGKAHKCSLGNPNYHRIGTVAECYCGKQWVVKNNIYFPSASSYFATFESQMFRSDYRSWEPYTERIVEVS